MTSWEKKTKPNLTGKARVPAGKKDVGNDNSILHDEVAREFTRAGQISWKKIYK